MFINEVRLDTRFCYRKYTLGTSKAIYDILTNEKIYTHTVVSISTLIQTNKARFRYKQICCGKMYEYILGNFFVFVWEDALDLQTALLMMPLKRVSCLIVTYK